MKPNAVPTLPDSTETRASTVHARHRWRGPLLGVLVGLLALVLAAPREPLITVDHDGAGWSLALQPLRTMITRGFFTPTAQFSQVAFDGADRDSPDGYCATEVGHVVGPLVLRRLYNWAAPDDVAATADARQAACLAQRKELMATPGTLAAALTSGQPDAVRRDLHATLTRGQTLALTLPEVGQPMRDTLARLMLTDPRHAVELQRLDVALAVGDKHVAAAWAAQEPDHAFTGYQRHAFYRLGLASTVTRMAKAQEDGRGHRGHFGFGAEDEVGRAADGFKRSDFQLANAYCDAGYASFLMKKGITPTDRTVVDAFVERIKSETPQALARLDLDYPYQDLEQQAWMQTSAPASPAACEALAQQYRGVSLPEEAVQALGHMTGAEMITDYQNYAKAQMQGKKFKTDTEEDAFYDALKFDQAHAPIPALPGMFTTLLADRPSGPAACAALSALPRMLDHDAAMAAFRQLAHSWRGKPLSDAQALASCMPGLVFPPSYIPQQTRDQNAFLHQAGIACTVSTPERRYVYNQKVSCDDAH